MPNFSPNDALLLVDVQRAFCPGGGCLIADALARV